ncbi:hypothetical protein [Bacillus tropicus]|uniref:hypothetical protein n=1 Tax=Bacillus tropicus TaxID=2026188 RepID=UPI0037FB7AC6
MRWGDLIFYILKTIVYLGVFFYALLSLYAPQYLDVRLALSMAMIAGFLELGHNALGTYKYFNFKDEKDEIKDELKQEIQKEIKDELKQEIQKEIKDELKQEIQKEIKDEITKEVTRQLQEEHKKNKQAILKEINEKYRLKEDGD